MPPFESTPTINPTSAERISSSANCMFSLRSPAWRIPFASLCRIFSFFLFVFNLNVLFFSMGFLFSCVIAVMCSAAAAAHEIQPTRHCRRCWEQSGGYRQTVMSRCPCPPFLQPTLQTLRTILLSFKCQRHEGRLFARASFFFFFPPPFSKQFSLFPVWPRVQNRSLYCPTVAFMCKLSLCMNAKCLLRMHSVYLE